MSLSKRAGPSPCTSIFFRVLPISKLGKNKRIRQEDYLNGISSQRIDFEADALISDDIRVQRYSAAYEAEAGDLTFGASFGYLTHFIDYNPNGTTNPLTRTEETFQGSLSLGYAWNDSLTSSISFSGYEGFTDYRSLWISEFFRQSFELFPQYEEADPYGFAISFGNSWEFANGVDRISLDLGYSRDRIAPGWEIGGLRFNEAESTDDILETFSGSLTVENYVTSTIKTQQTVRLSQVTDRELRTQLRTNWAWAPLDLYTDSGEITTSNFNTAAPALDSNEISASLLWTNGTHSLRGTVGFYQTDFEPSGVENIEFANLYRDRDFFALRGAYSLTF